MSIFGSILEKLGLRKPAAQAAPPPPAAPVPQPAALPQAPPTPVPIAVVDVMANMAALAAKNPQKLNWKVSTVDLLKLLGSTAVWRPARSWRSSSVARPRRWATRRR